MTMHHAGAPSRPKMGKRVLFLEKFDLLDSNVLDMYVYPVGCRDLYVCWIKINTLEEVSSVGACYLLY